MTATGVRAAAGARNVAAGFRPSAGGDRSVPVGLELQRLAGNRAVAGLVVQRDWVGDRSSEVVSSMGGDDFNQPGGPWFLLNGHNPEAIVNIMRRMGPQRRAQLAAHPPDAGRYDKPRLDLALKASATIGAKAAVSEVAAMDAIRGARSGAVTWEQCWTTVMSMPKWLRPGLFRRMDRTELRDLLTKIDAAPPLVQPALEAEINTVIAPPASSVLLDLVPDATEVPARDENELAAGRVKPMGRLTVYLKGVNVMSVPARGGPWISYGDRGHTADPTATGKHKLAAGKAIVTASWDASQLANGTPIRDTGTSIEFLRNGRWTDTMKLAKPISRVGVLAVSAKLDLRRQVRTNQITLADAEAQWTVMDKANDFGALRHDTWAFNDFGKEGFRLLGTPGHILHTTPETDNTSWDLKEGHLRFSHGCIHILGTDRQKLVEAGYLREGVTINVHPYDPAVAKSGRWGDPSLD